MNDTVEINNWIYSGDFVDIFSIKKTVDFLPDSLSKYYGLTENSIKAITESYIYVNHPSEFNDPYDSYRPFSFANGDSNGYQEFNLFFVNIGLVSMSEISTDMLMWAHYSGHDGFLVNFKVDSLKNKFQFLFPMNYIDSLPNLQIDNSTLKFMISTNIKSSKWRYEREWRLYYRSTPMPLPNVGHLHKEMNEKWIFKTRRTPKERKAKYDNCDINYVSLGYKFFLKEDHFQLNRQIILLNIKDKLKSILVDYLIEKGISIRLITYGDVADFGLRECPVIIKKIDADYKYEIIISAADAGLYPVL